VIPVEALLDLQRRLQTFPPRSHERRNIIQQVAELYNISETTLYRALRATGIPKALRRSDRGVPRVITKESMERYCELIAAIKVRTCNKKGRCLSTKEALRILTEYGIESPDGFCKIPAAIVSATTVNRYLRDWGYDRTTLGREPASVRFQASHSNECWQFDLSPSDLKEVKEPSWVREGKGNPTLMLFSVVDDRSGVSYQEYHCVYGEDVETALRFLFRAMSPKGVEDFPFQGIPAMIYMDNGPIPLHRFRQYKKSKAQHRADRIEVLAGKLVLPRSALAGHEPLPLAADSSNLKGEAFNRPDPYRELAFPSVLAAKLAIADHLGTPLAKLSPEQVAQINEILNETLDKAEVFIRVWTVFTKYAQGEAPC